MISFLETDKVKELALALLASMKQNNSYSIPSSIEYPLSLLRDTQMFAILTAKTKDGNEKILYGYSGSINGSYEVPGYVPPCFSISKFNEIVALNDKKIHELTDRIENGEKELEKERAALSNETLKKLKEIYTFSTYNGDKIHSLPDECPTGTGDCAGLKCINYALRRGWEITGLAEFDMKGNFHAPCNERCSLILPKMFGLDIIYADEDLAVINKPAGLLSVPGRGIEKLDSASYRFHTLFPSSPKECFVHRLDMDTSGLLIMAFNKEAHKKLSMEFENKVVKKTYTALLEGVLLEDGGEIDLPMRLDVDNRPYQIVDFERGKSAKTKWKRTGIVKYKGEAVTRVRFYPETGRTHQLRVHAAYGLKHPIVGDRLYGHNRDNERLTLHAESITFIHPRTEKEVTFTVPASF